MIRIIYLEDQIMDEAKDFAFYDTVTSRFLEFDGTQVFSDLKEFALYTDCPYWRRCMDKITPHNIDRLIHN